LGKRKQKEYTEEIIPNEGRPYYLGVRGNLFILEEDINKWIVPFTGKSENITGNTYDELFTVGYIGYRSKQPSYLFLCKCGRYTLKPKKYLTEYTSKKCCSYCSREVFKKSNTKWSIDYITSIIKNKVPERFDWVTKQDGRFGDQVFTCSICSFETTTTAENICKKKEELSCACANSKGTLQGWTKDTRTYQLNRLCNDQGYLFKGYVQGYSYNSKITLQCKRDRHIWTPTINGFTRGSKCPKCREDLDNKFLTKKPIEWYLDRYGKKGETDYSGIVLDGANSKVIFKCTIHGDYEQTPYNHFKSTKGCPSCADSGFNYNSPAQIYLNEVKGEGLHFLKIGITGSSVEHRRYLQQLHSGLDVQTIFIRDFTSGAAALKLEQEIRQTFECPVVDKITFPDGYTETLKLSDKDMIISNIKGQTGE
tara:strand:+ start:3994 stop:5262 length:1269 start_codon:yes stop_codon:yes gene_type:complete